MNRCAIFHLKLLQSKDVNASGSIFISPRPDTINNIIVAQQSEFLPPDGE